MRRLLAPLLVLATVTAACGDDAPSGAVDDVATFTLRERLVSIDDAVRVWTDADTIEGAHAAAETAANLVVGSGGPGYGDRDGNGTVAGDTEFGVLQGVDGEPVGLADALSDNQCVVDDVLGGSWDDPEARWAELDDAIANYSDDDNTIQPLASHPMRLVAWATLTLGSDDLDLAHEYASHAQLHVDVALEALSCDS